MDLNDQTLERRDQVGRWKLEIPFREMTHARGVEGNSFNGAIVKKESVQQRFAKRPGIKTDYGKSFQGGGRFLAAGAAHDEIIFTGRFRLVGTGRCHAFLGLPVRFGTTTTTSFCRNGRCFFARGLFTTRTCAATRMP